MDNRQILGRFVLAACVVIGIVAVMPRLRQAAHSGSDGTSQETQLVDAADHPQYAAKEGELRSKGIPVSLAELATPDPPASVNAAPLYLQLLDAHQFPETPMEDEAVRVTAPSNPPEAWVSARKLIGMQPRLIQTSNQAGLMPECHVDRSLTSVDPQAILFPEIAQMGRATRIITVESLLKAHDGHPVEAVALQSEGFTIAHHAQSDVGLLFSNFVGLECDNTTLDGMQRILTSAKGAPEVAAAIDASVAKNWRETLPSVALEHETAFGNSEIRYMETKGPSSLPDHGSLGQEMSRDQREWAGFIDVNGTYYLGLMQQSVVAARLPYPQLMQQLSTINWQRAHDLSLKDVLAGLLYPQVDGYCTRCYEISAKAAVTRAACAVFLYKSKLGHYPSTLAEVTSTATDPFDGNPLGYRREAKGFVVFSVGSTGEYNGGAFGEKKQHEEVFRYVDR